MRPSLTIATLPAEEPVSLAEFKLANRFDEPDLDSFLIGALQAAREQIEEEYGIRLVTQVWDAAWPCFPRSPWTLPLGRVQSVQSVKYTPAGGTQQTVSGAVYQLVNRNPPELVLKYGQYWPTGALETGDPVVVRYTVGWGGANAVPQRAKQAIMLLAGHLAEHREAVVIGTGAAAEGQEIPMGVRSLMDSLKHWS